MTTRYTNTEWTSLIRQTQDSIIINTSPCEYPRVHEPAFAQCFDHTLLKPETTSYQIDQLCHEARRYGFKSVCVRLSHVPRAVANLKGSRIAITCVIGFPEGTQSVVQKTREAQAAIAAGATELDMVLNYPLLLHSSYEAAFQELATIRSLAPAPIILKAILEVSQLTNYAIIAGCVLAANAHVDFVKTSTGFNGRGATVEDVRLMHAAVMQACRNGDAKKSERIVRVKASGGIRDLRDAVRMLEAGATRIGASAGVWIMQEAKEEVERRNEGLGGKEAAKLGITRLYSDESADY